MTAAHFWASEVLRDFTQTYVAVTLGETEKTEKTYLGTKIEILIRKFFKFPKGLLDLHIEGHDVDIKNTVGGNWMIPTEAIHPMRARRRGWRVFVRVPYRRHSLQGMDGLVHRSKP